MQQRIFPIAIDNSMRKELVKCETAAKYKYEMGLRAADGGRVDLIAGGAFAKGLETMRKAFYIAGCNELDAMHQGIQEVFKSYGSFVPPAKSNKTADRMAGALSFYATQCPFSEEVLEPVKFPDGTFGIEVGFNFPIDAQHPDGRQLSYCGRFDMLAVDKTNGDYWVVDEKTTSQMGDKWANQWPLDSQMTGYCWGANKLLEQHGLNARVKGAIINGIAIRLRDYEHGRFTAYRQDWMIERWYDQMLRNVKQWANVHKYDESYNMALDHQCAMYNNPCEFSPLCQSRNPERLIEGGSFIVSRWNPLTREES